MEFILKKVNADGIRSLANLGMKETGLEVFQAISGHKLLVKRMDTDTLRSILIPDLLLVYGKQNVDEVNRVSQAPYIVGNAYDLHAPIRLQLSQPHSHNSEAPGKLLNIASKFWVLVSAIVREMISIRVNEDDGYAEVISHPRFAPDLSCYRLFDEVGAT
uniref:Uncharacterized protein n=1 Tax=Salix viminalis TaxID=40686 RepID=A0A6N2LB68_SALVM